MRLNWSRCAVCSVLAMTPSNTHFWGALILTVLFGAATASVVVPLFGLLGYAIYLWLLFFVTRTLLRGIR